MISASSCSETEVSMVPPCDSSIDYRSYQTNLSQAPLVTPQRTRNDCLTKSADMAGAFLCNSIVVPSKETLHKQNEGKVKQKLSDQLT